MIDPPPCASLTLFLAVADATSYATVINTYASAKQPDQAATIPKMPYMVMKSAHTPPQKQRKHAGGCHKRTGSGWIFVAFHYGALIRFDGEC